MMARLNLNAQMPGFTDTDDAAFDLSERAGFALGVVLRSCIYVFQFWYAFFWNARMDAGCGNPYLRQLRNESLVRLLRMIWPDYEKRTSLRST